MKIIDRAGKGSAAGGCRKRGMEKVEYFILVCRSHSLTTSNLPSSIPRKARPNSSTTAACDVGQLLILRLGRKGNGKRNGKIQPLPLSAGGDCREICVAVVVAARRRITAYLVCSVQPINMQSGPAGLSHEDETHSWLSRTWAIRWRLLRCLDDFLSDCKQ